MSTNYTQNYNLCQWEAGDKVLRVDFNEDNAKLDTALTRIEATANAAKAQAQTITDSAYTKTDYPPFVAGTYYGNGGRTQVIALGFRPKFVLVFPESKPFYSSVEVGAAVDGKASANISIVDNGFQVTADDYGGGTNGNMKFIYFALR